jgi:hypothetical protein
MNPSDTQTAVGAVATSLTTGILIITGYGGGKRPIKSDPRQPNGKPKKS